MNGKKSILDGEKETAKFAYASIVTISDIEKGEHFSTDNIWVKRPGTGKIRAEFFDDMLNKKSSKSIKKNSQLEWDMVDD